jgi:hypothetical protein
MSESRRSGVWFSVAMAGTVIVAVVLTMTGLVHPVAAFLGALGVCVALALAAAAIRGPGGIRVQAMLPRSLVGVVVWLVAIGTYVYVLATCSAALNDL